MTDDCRKWLDKTANEFMVPVAEYFNADEAFEYCPSPELDETPDREDYGAGWYSRLSAPGYLDCTDWQGPYATEEEALEALYETYAD